MVDSRSRDNTGSTDWLHVVSGIEQSAWRSPATGGFSMAGIQSGCHWLTNGQWQPAPFAVAASQ